MHSFAALFYPAFILGVCLLPFYLFRRSWKETGIIACVVIYFFILNKDLLGGRQVFYHDTRFTYEYLLMIFKQWLDSGAAVGWNPYMNAGEPLYLFSNYFLWAPWVLFCWINKFTGINAHALFNMFWLFLFVNFCVGGLLFFLALYDNFKAALFSFIALMLGGMFIVNLGQPMGLATMYYLPYILFCLALSVKRKDIYGFVLAVAFSGIALNHYLPHYVFLAAGICVFFFLAFNFRLLPAALRLLGSGYRFMLLALAVALLAASPAMFLAGEMRNYVSPSRGGALAGAALEPGRSGYQPGVKASLSDYRILLKQDLPSDANIHHAFYFGIVPLLLMPLAIFGRRNRRAWAILASAALLIFLGSGNDFWGYRLLIKYVPGFNMIRHSFGLAQFAAFFLICLSGFGLKELLRDNGRKQLFFWLAVIVLLTDLSLFYVRHNKSNASQALRVTPANIVYPRERSLYPSQAYPLPPDISPLIYKKAALKNPFLNFTLFRDKRLNDILNRFLPENGYELALGVGGPLIYFTQDRGALLSEEFYNMGDNGAAGQGAVDYIQTNKPNELEVLVKAPAPGLLVRLESFHPGWQAFIDGEKTRVHRANYTFQAIEVPEGRHRVVFRFATAYPVLLYIHILCVFLTWAAFNIYLFSGPRLAAAG
ncbi:MAG: YfhO family protein [Candidatus Omnitrophica bacterium]|nr:YfhO family protein [Candidatus Omnitrophota bacterium]